MLRGAEWRPCSSLRLHYPGRPPTKPGVMIGKSPNEVAARVVVVAKYWFLRPSDRVSSFCRRPGRHTRRCQRVEFPGRPAPRGGLAPQMTCPIPRPVRRRPVILDNVPPEPLPIPRTPETVIRELRKLHGRGDLELPLPGRGQTMDRWRSLARFGRRDLCLARLAEGHADAAAILAEAGHRPAGRTLYGVWASRSGERGQPYTAGMADGASVARSGSARGPGLSTEHWWLPASLTASSLCW